MKASQITVNGVAVSLIEAGEGRPTLYLHGFADVHGATDAFLPFHTEVARGVRLIAPAHPGCGGSAEDDGIDSIEDLVFHYLQVIDALGLDRLSLVGSAIGGWIAAELAVRIPERIDRLALIGATGLFLPDQPIGDLFMMVQSENGTQYAGYRAMLFRGAQAPEALEMFPDGRMPIERESARYRMFRFASRVGFRPPYFYHRRLLQRLVRYRGPALVIAGKQDQFVPESHAHAYAKGLAGARLELIDGAGSAVVVEQPALAGKLVRDFLA